MMMEEYDDLFTDALNIPPSPPPKGLYERLDELRSSGALRYVHRQRLLGELAPDSMIERSPGLN